MSENIFNTVVILDAIPEGQLNTARLLKQDLEDIASYVRNGLQVFYARIVTMDSLEDTISVVLRKNREDGLQPLLHLDGHGLPDQSGFALAGGTPCSWNKFRDVITPINVSMGLNLLLVMATCYGGSFATAIRIIDRAPVWGLIGPTGEVTAGQSEESFRTFYLTFFRSLSGSEAIKALNASASKSVYFITTAEQFFYDVWRSYKKQMCSEDIIEKRARRMYREAKSKNLPKTPSIGFLKRQLCGSSNEKKLFEKYRDTYFMYDLYPSNRNRFPVTYEKAEAYIKEQ